MKTTNLINVFAGAMHIADQVAVPITAIATNANAPSALKNKIYHGGITNG
jgi:hypothetical protein